MIPTVHTSTLYTTLYLVYVCVPVVLLIPDLLRMRQTFFCHCFYYVDINDLAHCSLLKDDGKIK